MHLKDCSATRLAQTCGACGGRVGGCCPFLDASLAERMSWTERSSVITVRVGSHFGNQPEVNTSNLQSTCPKRSVECEIFVPHDSEFAGPCNK